MTIADSELILNPDGSIYHLNLHPEDIATTVITVGDPDRVDQVTKHFDTIRFKSRKREFHVQTGMYRHKEITVLSTGIGTDNIDIVLNELDALVNINLKTREIKSKLTSLDIIRIGTSGAIQKEIDLNSFIVSETAIGMDATLQFYDSSIFRKTSFLEAFQKHLDWKSPKIHPYIVSCDPELKQKLSGKKTQNGITLTNSGFYAPQGRTLRISSFYSNFYEKISSFHHDSQKITNLEMETSAIYALSQLMGHRAISMNVILANRATGQFSSNANKAIDELITYSLNQII